MGYGGVERTIAEFADALRRAGEEVLVVNDVRHGRMRDEYPFARSLERRLESIPYDILHASTPVVARALARHHRTFVYTSHSRHWFDRHGLTDYWGYHLERRAVRAAARTVALTPRLADAMSASVGSDIRNRLVVIPIGVDVDRFQPDWGRRTGRIALGVGAVIPAKRWELAARALDPTNVEFRLAGPTPEPSYASRVRQAGPRAKLLGELTDEELREEYARADFLVHPSRVEVLPGVVLQAFAAGLPVLGGDAIRTLVDEGQTGWCSALSEEPEGLLELVRARAQQLAADPSLRRTMGDRARAVATERFDWRRVVDLHLDLYHEVLGARPAATPPGSPGP